MMHEPFVVQAVGGLNNRPTPNTYSGKNPIVTGMFYSYGKRYDLQQLAAFFYLYGNQDVKTEAEIISLANKKIKAAELLLQEHFYDDAYYLGGYGFELLLKAKICKTLAIADFFDFDNSKTRKLPTAKARRGERENLYKPFKVHDYEQLLILSGLYKEFESKIANDLTFSADWSVVSKWDESMRYATGSNSQDVQSFINSVKNMMQWLTQYLQKI